MGYNVGISSNVEVPPGNNSGVEQLSQIMSKIKGGTQIGRVTDIILNDQYPDIESYGGLNGIGTIFYELNNFVGNKSGVAKPMFPQMSSFPLVNEMVLLFKLPNTNIGKNTSEESYYYLNMVSLWNHPHHNAYPNPITTNTLEPSQQRDYTQTTGGAVRRVTDTSTDIELNSPVNPSQATFIERSNIHPILPFAGDVINQGRWGNSIRFGSTARSMNLNNWSDSGKNGDPITILRNGQPTDSSPKGWVPISEDINKDLTSLYLTSTQQIPISLSCENYISYETPPEDVKSYLSPQAIISSDRVIINAKSDSILLSAQNSISLSTNNSINLNTNNFIVDANSIKLGSKEASEYLVKGDTLVFQMDQILKVLVQLTEILKTSQVWPGGVPSLDVPKNQIIANVQTSLELIKEDLDSMLSRTVKTV